ncbi:TPA: hypothetical protein ACGW5N_005702 [Bacillus mobilis]
MTIKQRVECMDKNCRAVVTGRHLDGLSCPECGGPTLPKPFTAKEGRELGQLIAEGLATGIKKAERLGR